MSRSYKKFPFVQDRDSSKWGKRYCNKRVRKTMDIPNGKFYRKLTEPWDYIYDHCSSETWKEYKQGTEMSRWWREPKEANYFDWYRCYKMK